MIDRQSDTTHLDNNILDEIPSQNWGAIIGVTIVLFCGIALVINLLMVEPSPDTAPLVLFWLQLARIGGVLVVFCGGGWLLWRLLRSPATTDEPYLQPYLHQADHYTHQIRGLLETSTDGREKQLLSQLDTWQHTIETMAHTLIYLGQNHHTIQQDLAQLPATISALESQIDAETNTLLKQDLGQMLAQRQNQQMALEQLQITRRRAEIQIERTIAVLATIYSKLLTYRSTFHVVDYQHLANNVAEEVQSLQDYLEALQEVKGG